MLKEKIKQLASESFEEVVFIRRHLHQHPELSFQEQQTSRFILEKLKSWGIACEGGWAETGVVAVIEGRHAADRCVALRADIDALPIEEQNAVPYKSQNPGVMHACGHDVHTASLMGAAKILYRLRSHFDGSIKLIFQPGEEKLPGGASLMISEGVLEKAPAPQEILGQHVSPELPVGTIGIRAGRFMASADEIYLRVKGKGGHAAMPHQVIDPVLAAAQIIVALQHVVSRKANPLIPSVLSFGKINSSGGATNVIPDEVRIEGTFRTFDEIWRKSAWQIIEKTARGVAESLGAFCEVRIEEGYPALINEEKLTARIRAHAVEFLGESQVVEIPMRMSAEDFAFYSQRLPACFYRLGTASPNGKYNASVHTSHFDIDEKALQTGMGLMAWLAIRELERIQL